MNITHKKLTLDQINILFKGPTFKAEQQRDKRNLNRILQKIMTHRRTLTITTRMNRLSEIKSNDTT